MAGMEGIEPIAKKEEEEIEEEEEDEEVVEDISRSIENGITLYQPELLVIYIAIHWVWKLDGTPWNDVEIKQIVGHAILELDEDTYDHLDLGDVTKQLCRGDDDLTKIVKIKAEGLKETLMPWIPQLYKKYLEMCKKDEILAKQRDDEIAAQQVTQRASNLTRPEKRRHSEDIELHDSIAAVPSRSSGGSQSGHRAANATRSSKGYPSIAEVLAGSSSNSQDGSNREKPV